MKPLHLVMSAFGSYAGEERVDFSKAGNGVFLITGDTGAGKTTVFDAMVYALYDRTSGGERSGNMMRSQFAKPETETFVVFSFSVRNQIYTVRRNPEYQIQKQLKNGKVVERKVSKSVELILPNGEAYPEKRAETDQKIVELLGLDATQFTQTVMLAQGDFLKLLYTKSDHRKTILSKIFKTGLYYRLEEELKRRAFQAEEKLSDCKKAMQQEFENLRLAEEEHSIEKLEVYRREQKDKTKEQEKQKEENRKRLSELTEKLGIQEQINRQFQQLRKTEEELEKIKEKVQAAEKQEMEWNKIWQKQEELLQKEIMELERSLPIYEQVEAGRKKEAEAQKRLRELEKGTGIFGKARKAVEEKRLLWEGQVQTAKQAGELYEKMYQSFFREQAGILAGTLKAGEPCPVCGSMEHPNPAKAAAEAPTHEEVEQAKKKREQAETEREGLEKAFLAEKERCEKLQKEEETKAQILLAEAKKELEISQKELLYNSIEEAKTALKEKRNQLKHFEQQVEQAEKLRKQWEEKQQLCLGQREQLLKNTKDQKEEDIEAARIQKEEWTRQQKQLERELQESHIQAELYERALNNLKKYEKKRVELQEQATVLDNLYKTANGRLSGSAKIDFETYMQRKYFRLILAEANKRLIKMNRGSFLLRLKEGENVGKSKNEGLDLEVYSMVTNSIRDVKTLSGGESFLAALSMALGLSDIVQKTAGAVQLDVMFIDEGFGSLDEMSRQQAIEVLQELAGEHRQVGIISHVSELKEQLEKKLIVEKGEAGSKIRWEM